MLHDPQLQRFPPSLKMRKLLPTEQQWQDPQRAAEALQANLEERRELEEYLKSETSEAYWIGHKSISMRFDNLQAEIVNFEKEYVANLHNKPWRECQREMKQGYMPSYVFHMITSVVKSLAIAIRAELFEAMKRVTSGSPADHSQHDNASTFTSAHEVEEESKPLGGNDFSI